MSASASCRRTRCGASRPRLHARTAATCGSSRGRADEREDDERP
jgi:hypothetical protein